MVDDTGPNRIQGYIPTQLEQVGILLHENGFISALKDVSRLSPCLRLNFWV